MKINKHFKLEILKRFMFEEELEKFQKDYNDAKLIERGRLNLIKEDD